MKTLNIAFLITFLQHYEENLAPLFEPRVIMRKITYYDATFSLDEIKGYFSNVWMRRPYYFSMNSLDGNSGVKK